MGMYLNYEVETKCEDPEIIALALSGMVGEFFSVKRGENDVYFVFNDTSSMIFQCQVTAGEGMEIFTFCEKNGGYEDTARDKFSEGTLAERLAVFLGDCKVTISADKGVTPHPEAKDGVYSYHTEAKDNQVWKSKEAIRASIMAYPPVLIAKEVDNDRSPGWVERLGVSIRTINENRFLFKNQSGRSNARALSYFSGKELEDITKEDAVAYVSRDDALSSVGRIERTAGIVNLFYDMGRPDIGDALAYERAKGLEERAAKKLFEKKASDVRNSFYGIEYETELKGNGKFSHKGKSFILSRERSLALQNNDVPSAMLEMPFGCEEITVDVSEVGAISYMYKATDVSNYSSRDELRRKSSESLYETLDNIHSPSFLEHMLKNISNDTPFLSAGERQALNAKLPDMRKDEKEARDFMRATFHYLNVPYAEKDEAKELGAKWDSRRKSWMYDPRDPKITDFSVFEKWEPEDVKVAEDSEQMEER